jgi:predicted DNA-binding protein with PD1-like motif
MDYKKSGNTYIIRFDRGEEIIKQLGDFCTEKEIKLGWVTGIGAVSSATLGLFRTGTKNYVANEFTGEYEVSSLTGNISTMDGKTYLHIHATISDIEQKTFGGHLNSAVVSAVAELVVGVMEGSADRCFSEDTGLNILKFD